jgi:tRNA-splicing ligase RtcB
MSRLTWLQKDGIDSIPVFGVPDEGAERQILHCFETADACALMADNHQGYAAPVGGVLVYKDKISPNGVGFDIACGNCAVLLDVSAAEVRANIKTIMDDIWKTLSFGVGLNNNESVEHPLFEADGHPAWKLRAAAPLKRMAQNQLGTIGSGNHYVDLFVDEQERVWCGVHFGSRGLGHKIATYFIEAGGGKDGIDVDPVLLPVNSELGQNYLTCMDLAGQYAYAGRDWVCDRVASLIGAPVLDRVHNHHNFAWLEEHLGEMVWVVRKGATPAFPGQRGFVGGSMGDVSVIIEGVESIDSQTAFYSTVHGAGRVMSRTKAAGKRKFGRNAEGRRVVVSQTGGAVTREMMDNWIRPMNVELRGAGVDESPHCYKRLPEVLEAHGDTIKVLHTLTPIGVAMAGDDVEDPYKD